MKTIICLLILIAFQVLPFETSAQHNESEFEFDPNRIQTGIVYHYTKSNIDGSRPIRVSLYQKTTDSIEVYKYEEGYEDAAHIKAVMDWENFVPKHIDAFVFTKDSVWQTAHTEWNEKSVSVDVHVLNHKKDTVFPRTTPAHMYNFDFASLNVALKFLKHPEGELNFGIVDPTYIKDNSDIFYYRGDARLKYIKDVKNNKERLYEVTGRGINFTKGYIWVNKTSGMISDMEIPVPDNPGWYNFKLKLIKTENMTADEWSTYLYSNF